MYCFGSVAQSTAANSAAQEDSGWCPSQLLERRAQASHRSYRSILAMYMNPQSEGELTRQNQTVHLCSVTGKEVMNKNWNAGNSIKKQKNLWDFFFFFSVNLLELRTMFPRKVVEILKHSYILQIWQNKSLAKYPRWCCSEKGGDIKISFPT